MGNNNEYDRIKDRFLLLKKEKRKGLIPFITASDPNIDIFEEDISACAVFTSNLFVSNCFQCVAFDKALLRPELSPTVVLNIRRVGAQFPP